MNMKWRSSGDYDVRYLILFVQLGFPAALKTFHLIPLAADLYEKRVPATVCCGYVRMHLLRAKCEL